MWRKRPGKNLVIFKIFYFWPYEISEKSQWAKWTLGVPFSTKLLIIHIKNYVDNSSGCWDIKILVKKWKSKFWLLKAYETSMNSKVIELNFKYVIIHYIPTNSHQKWRR